MLRPLLQILLISTSFMKISSLILSLILCLFSFSQSFASVAIEPKRIIFSNGEFEKKVRLHNLSKTPQRFRLFLVKKLINDQGQFYKVQESPEHKAYRRNIVYSPKQFLISPGEKKEISIFLKAEYPQQGEYNWRLNFQNIPEIQSQVQRGKQNNSGVKVQVIAALNLNIPLMVQGILATSSAKLGSYSHSFTEDEDLAIEFSINRFGDKSVFTDIRIDWQNPGQKKTISLSKIKSFYVLYPQEYRNFSLIIPQKNLENKNIDPNGSLSITVGR